MDVGDADKGLDALRQTRIHRAKPFCSWNARI